MAKKKKKKKPMYLVENCGGKKGGRGGCNSWGGATKGQTYISIAA